MSKSLVTDKAKRQECRPMGYRSCTSRVQGGNDRRCGQPEEGCKTVQIGERGQPESGRQSRTVANYKRVWCCTVTPFMWLIIVPVFTSMEVTCSSAKNPAKNQTLVTVESVTLTLWAFCYLFTNLSTHMAFRISVFFIRTINTLLCSSMFLWQGYCWAFPLLVQKI